MSNNRKLKNEYERRRIARLDDAYQSVLALLRPIGELRVLSREEILERAINQYRQDCRGMENKPNSDNGYEMRGVIDKSGATVASEPGDESRSTFDIEDEPTNWEQAKKKWPHLYENSGSTATSSTTVSSSKEGSSKL